MPPGPLKIYSTDAPPSDMPTNTVELYQARLLNCQNKMHACWSSATPCRELLCRFSCNIYVCWPSDTATNTAAVQTCLLVGCCCKMGACWTVATQNLQACRSFATQSCMSAGAVLLYLSYLLVWCLTISRACGCCASL